VVVVVPAAAGAPNPKEGVAAAVAAGAPKPPKDGAGVLAVVPDEKPNEAPNGVLGAAADGAPNGVEEAPNGVEEAPNRPGVAAACCCCCSCSCGCACCSTCAAHVFRVVMPQIRTPRQYVRSGLRSFGFGCRKKGSFGSARCNRR
jgi:hypothetical protein